MSLLPSATNYDTVNSFFALAGSGGGGNVSTATTLVPRGYLTLNSEDRYPGSITPRNPSLQTTATNITYSIPGLSSISNLQLVNFQVAGGQWNETVRAENYTNVINVIDYSIPSTFLITIPSGQLVSNLTGNNLTNYIREQLGAPSATQGSYPAIGIWGSSGATGAYDFINTTTLPGSLVWTTGQGLSGTVVPGGAYSNHNFGFAPVSSINGVNIGGYRQLYDMLGLVGHVSSVGGVNTSFGGGILPQTSNWGSPGYGGAPVQNYWTKFIDIASPQLASSTDASSSSTAPAGLIARMPVSVGSAWSLAGVSLTTGSTQAPKVLRVPPGLSSLTIQMYDDHGRPLVPAISTLQTATVLPISSFNTTATGIEIYTSTFANFLSVGQLMTGGLSGYPVFYGAGLGSLPNANTLFAISSLSTTATNTLISFATPFASPYQGISRDGTGGTSTLSWYNVGLVSSIGNMIGPEYTAQFSILTPS